MNANHPILPSRGDAAVAGMPRGRTDMVRLRFFASLRETLGVSDEQVRLPGDITRLSELSNWLQCRGEPWQEALSDSRLHIAINQEIVRQDVAIKDGDEVAWFPPVTGG